MQTYTITVSDTGDSYRCREDRSVLEGMEALGRKGIPVGCRNGGCGVCKVRIDSGLARRRVMSRKHLSECEAGQGYALACRIYPQSDLVVSVVGRIKRAFGGESAAEAAS